MSPGGHPPAILPLPLVLVIWALGHGVIWGIARLAARGKAEAGVDSRWPPALIVALIGTGIIAAAGLVQLVTTLMLVGQYPFEGALWIFALVVAVAHGACFVGLLLRHARSAPGTALLAVGWALLLGWLVLEDALYTARFGSAEAVGYGAALVAGILLVLLARHLVASPRIRTFLGRG
jgi:hypothetical protein